MILDFTRWSGSFFVIVVSILLIQTSCSSTTNTLAGLATPQSTISGSNYVFFVDPENRQLFPEPPPQWNANFIRAGDPFVISLDSGFLRYLQAVDPYVIIYSEAWMGSKPKPVDPESIHRQVVLIKDGLSHNANIPLTSIPLLGPVTLGEGYHDVHVSLKVVVLSKSDNAQTVQLLNGIAGIVSTAAPVYGPAAGAAAEIGAAIVAQNRDKIEFEHNFTFTPSGTQFSIGRHESFSTLRESKIVVIKGENESRLVPYQHWGYYLWPFNWFGSNTDSYSRRFESKREQIEGNYFNVLYGAVRIPFWVIKSFFVPAEWFIDARKGTFPTELVVDGQFLFCKEVPEETRKDVNYFRKQLIFMSHLFGTGDRGCPHYYPYTEKTFILLSVKKTKGTFGSFEEMVKGFSDHAATIDKLTTTSSDSREHLTANIDRAFKRIEESISFSHAKREVREKAKAGYVDTTQNFSALNIEDIEVKKDSIEFLVNLSVEENVYYTTERFLSFAKDAIDRIRKSNEESPVPNEIKKNAENLEGFFENLFIPYIKKNTWEIKEDNRYKELWLQGWKMVLENVRIKVFELGGKEVVSGFKHLIWESLIPRFEISAVTLRESELPPSK